MNFISDNFQLEVYFALTLLNILSYMLGAVGWLINISIKSLRFEGDIIAYDSSSVKYANSQQVKVEVDTLLERRPLSRIVGFLERQLYLYAMLTQVYAVLSGVLLFKAFSGWLATHSTGESESKSLKTLATFYTYAIGNFISLGWAIFLYEIFRWVVQHNEMLRSVFGGE